MITPTPPPCAGCVSEYGKVDPNCPHCKGSGVCASAGETPRAEETPRCQECDCELPEITALRQQVQALQQQVTSYREAPLTTAWQDHLGQYQKRIAQAEADARALREALEKAIEVIRTWHGMGMPTVLEGEAWKLYQKSPEMKAIRAALASPSSTRQET